MYDGHDARGVRVRWQTPPQRIVSLVPSTTASLFDLGVGDRVVGVTRFCVHPADQLRGLARVGGTKDVELDRVRTLAPDLILGNCEENTRAIFDDLAPLAPLHAGFPRTIDEAVDELAQLGRLVDAEASAAAWVQRIREARRAPRGPTLRVAYLIWRDPWMTASATTYLHSVLAELGLHNVFAHLPDRFPVVTAQDLAAACPDLVLLSSEPFPFRARHADELAAATGLDRSVFRAVDGEAFTWHGTRMARALASLHDDLSRGFDPVT